MSFSDWATALLVDPKIAAPTTKTNLATLAGWTTHEKGSLDGWAQWCNPFNTTEPYPGALNSGAQPGAHDVKIYRTLNDGHAATVITLTWEPGGTGTAYSAIVRNLRRSLPARFWQDDARSQLDTWGTGAGWLNSVPLQGDSPMEELINRIYAGLFGPSLMSADFATKYKAYLGLAGDRRFDALDAAIAAIAIAPAPAPAPDLAQLKADVASMKAMLERIEAAFRAA